VFAPLLLLVFWMGVMPQPFLDRAQPALDQTLELTRTRAVRSAQMAGLPAPREAMFVVLDRAVAARQPVAPGDSLVVTR
jgi:hypothetical protein